MIFIQIATSINRWSPAGRSWQLILLRRHPAAIGIICKQQRRERDGVKQHKQLSNTERGSAMQGKKTGSENISSYCTKCRLNLDHTVMAKDGEIISRVRCKTCGSTHKFRKPVDPQKIQKTRPKKKSGLGIEATAAIIWEAGLAEAKGKERDYSMSAKYRVGDIVNHHVFGKGVVLKLYVNKCDMLFRDRERLMASANECRRI
jgi:hypothetical protein